MKFDDISSEEMEINKILIQADKKRKFYETELSFLLPDKGPEPILAPPGFIPARPAGSKNKAADRLHDLIAQTKSDASKQVNEIYKNASQKAQENIDKKVEFDVYPKNLFNKLTEKEVPEIQVRETKPFNSKEVLKNEFQINNDPPPIKESRPRVNLGYTMDNQSEGIKWRGSGLRRSRL